MFGSCPHTLEVARETGRVGASPGKQRFGDAASFVFRQGFDGDAHPQRGRDLGQRAQRGVG